VILLLGGTSETAPIAAALVEAGWRVLVSVATEVPLEIGDHPLLTRRVGRLDAIGMAEVVREQGITALVDATHPYAAQARATARQVAEAAGLPYLTFVRPALVVDDAWVLPAADHAEAARLACARRGPVLLTTGSRNLEPYVRAARAAGVPLFARVLPGPESVAACRAAGLAEAGVLTGRGPFSVEQNLAVLRQFGIGVLVTKNSGIAGGLPEKLEAARQAGCQVVIVRRPDQPSAQAYGSVAELREALEALRGEHAVTCEG
jgi:precorrin-6A/cobalt-precorrin-6A reductase